MRKASTNTRLELIRVIESFEDLYDIKNKLEKDFKIEFDLENCSDFNKDDFSEENREGYFQSNGTYMYLGWAGGDWENAVYFVLYLDPKKKLRAYIPTEGNSYNKKYKSAYGNNDDDDEYVEADFDLMMKDIRERIEVEPRPKTDYDVIRDLQNELEPYWQSEGSEWGAHISTLCDLDTDCMTKEFVPYYIKELKSVLETCKEQTEIVDGEIIWL